ncbi:kinase-like protein [Nemania sp. FL0031]|nr:kinase-like protein [Nemania sp. FL0031]
MASSTTPPDCPAEEDIGYYVDQGDEHEVEGVSEPRERYVFDNNILSRWYCPIRIGDVLNKQYKIVHKLGWGGFSTVWLARELTTNLLVGLKILCPSPQAEAEHRIQLEIIERCGLEISEYLVILQGAFHLRNPDRVPLSPQYRVLVLPVKGPSLLTWCFNVQHDVRVSAARHLLAAIKRLHAAEIIHTDINSGAVMWDLEPITEWSNTKIYNEIGRPQKVRLLNDENRHFADLVGDWNIERNFKSTLLRPSLSLGDFSHAVVASEAKQSTQWPLTFCAPERYHGQEPSFASDMWGFMLIFVQLYCGSTLGFGNGSTFVSSLVGALGPFPEEWKGMCTLSDAQDWWYDQTGQFPPTDHLTPYASLELKLAFALPRKSTEERELAAKIIRKGLSYRPEERLTAAQLLEDPAFNSLLGPYEREVASKCR